MPSIGVARKVGPVGRTDVVQIKVALSEWRHADLTDAFLAIQRHAAPIDRSSQPISGLRKITRKVSLDAARFTWTGHTQVASKINPKAKQVAAHLWRFDSEPAATAARQKASNANRSLVKAHDLTVIVAGL